MSNETQIIEINGVKMEVDLRYAKRVDRMVVGSRVKLLTTENQYGTKSNKVYPGVVVGFEPFTDLPTIIVAYLDIDYSGANLKFAYINTGSKEKYDIILSVDEELPIQKADVLGKLDRDIEKKREEIADLELKRNYFLSHFNRYFEPAAV